MSSAMSDSSTQQHQKANLARIRDNQRRSRARRKEYLQELEAKYRTCEAVGVEASAEIQSAARRVVEENKRLRQLLKQQGFNDTQIDAALVRDSPHEANAGEALDTMLGSRKTCKPGGGCGGGRASPESSVGNGELANRRWSCGPTITSQPDSLPQLAPHPPTMQSEEVDVKPIIPETPLLQNAIRTGTTTPFTQPAYDEYQYPAYSQAMMPLSDHAQWHVPPHNDSMMNEMSHTQYPQNSGQMGVHTQFYADPNSSSCQQAASMIHALNPEAGREELERALGCGNGAECSVDNSVVFDVMDRYAG